MVTVAQLVMIMPAAIDRAAAFVDPLNDAMHEFAINTARREAAFLAQIAEESGELRWLTEIASGEAYEGRKDLGNTQPGDGPRFKGRGLLQATGRAQYATLAKALQLDLIEHPELLAQPGAACRSAGWVWTVEKRLNPHADLDEFGTITKLINGGYAGLDSRLSYWIRGRAVEGL